jgi:hypothetical protein
MSLTDPRPSTKGSTLLPKVLRRAGLTTAARDWNVITSLFMAAQPYFPYSVPGDTDTDDAYVAAAASDSDSPSHD